MGKWVPGVAVFGLICVMVLPAPGIWGVLIGGICILAIVVSAFVWALDQMSSRISVRYTRWRSRRPASSQRAVHAGSGVVKRVGTRKFVAKRV